MATKREIDGISLSKKKKTNDIFDDTGVSGLADQRLRIFQLSSVTRDVLGWIGALNTEVLKSTNDLSFRRFVTERRTMKTLERRLETKTTD